MIMVKWKVGDYVKIVDQVNVNMKQEAKKYLGTIMQIALVYKEYGYKMVEDEQGLIWDDSVFERLATKCEIRGLRWMKLMDIVKKEGAA